VVITGGDQVLLVGRTEGDRVHDPVSMGVVSQHAAVVTVPQETTRVLTATVEEMDRWSLILIIVT